MATVLEAFVSLRPEVSRFKTDMQTLFKGGNLTAGLDRSLDNSVKKVGMLAGAIKGVAAIAGGVLIAQGVMQLPQLFNKATTAASDLNESQNAARQVFRESAEAILEWGRQNASSYGLSQRSFNQLASVQGAMLRNQGFQQDEVARSTVALTKRAADMASIFGGEVADALEAINSGLRGESDPLERFGVSLNEAAVAGKALAMTGKASAESLTTQEKAAARLALIFEQTAATEGDHVATSNELANASKNAAASMENQQAVIGQKLLPLALQLTKAKLELSSAVTSHVVPALDRFGGWFNANRANITGTLQAIADAAGPMLKSFAEGIAGLLPLMRDLFNFVISNRAAMVAAIAAVGLAVYTALGPFSAAFLAVAGLITLYGKLREAMAESVSVAALNKASGRELTDQQIAAIRAGAKNLAMNPVDLAATARFEGGTIGPGTASSPGTFGVTVRGKFVPIDQLGEQGLFDIKMPEGADEAARAAARLTSSLIGSGGLVVGSGAAADAIEDLAKRAVAASQQIEGQQTSDVVKAFFDAMIKGADPDAAIAQARSVIAQQDSVWAQMVAALHEKIGVAVPNEFRSMWEQMVDASKTGGRDTVRSWQDELRQRLASVGRLLPAGLGGGSSRSETHIDQSLHIGTIEVRTTPAGRIDIDQLIRDIDDHRRRGMHANRRMEADESRADGYRW